MYTDAWCGPVALSETEFHMMPVLLLISNINRCVWRHDTGMSTPPLPKKYGDTTHGVLRILQKVGGNTSPCPSTPMQIYRKAYPYRLSPSYSRTTSMAIPHRVTKRVNFGVLQLRDEATACDSFLYELKNQYIAYIFEDYATFHIIFLHVTYRRWRPNCRRIFTHRPWGASRRSLSPLTRRRTCRFIPSGGRNHRQYSLRITTEGWPGWVGLSGLDKYRNGRPAKGGHPSQY